MKKDWCNLDGKGCDFLVTGFGVKLGAEEMHRASMELSRYVRKLRNPRGFAGWIIQGFCHRLVCRFWCGKTREHVLIQIHTCITPDGTN